MIQTLRMTVSLMVDNVTLCESHALLCTPSSPLFSGSMGVQAKQVTVQVCKVQ